MQATGVPNASTAVRVARSSAADLAVGISDVPAAYQGSGPPNPRTSVVHSPLPPAGEFYSKALGWPVTIAGGGVAVKCGDSLDVIEIPARYGPRVRELLHERSMRAPIIATLTEDHLTENQRQPSTWAFICQVKPPHGQHVMVTQLAMHGVLHIGQGIFPLPPSAASNSRYLEWIYPAPLQTPTSPLPPWAVVASCALTATRKPTRLR
jgi:hypothetical protein